MHAFAGFEREALETLLVDGIGERWAAVQERLHPPLAALAERLEAAGRERFPREWPLYEISWKAARYRHRGGGRRGPIEEYHFALDRVPRGTGIYIGVSAEERSILVGFTSTTGARKPEMRRVWEAGRALWLPLLGALPEVRFSRAAAQADEPWIEAYLRSRQARYLWAGYRFAWDDPVVATPSFAELVVDAALRLLPFNESFMEEAEALDYDADLAVREQRTGYNVAAMLPSGDEIVERIARRGYTYPEAVLRSYHVALQTKPLVVMPGISGSGKTRLTRLYADAVHGVESDAAPNPYYLLVAVQPDWHNARDLLGFHNALTGRFQPTALLRFLLRAAADPASPYYVCLDEMNLARPEYYLAPVLSALETPEHSIDLGIPGASAVTVDGETLRQPFGLPLNVHFTGTVNVDESTFGLSDKLLDRANVIELSEIDLQAFRDAYREPVDATAWRVIEAAETLLQAAGQPFGYRTIAEILRFVARARDDLPPRTALDLQIRQKVLPKLRGEDSPRLRTVLTQLAELFAVEQLPQSAAKIRRMIERLDHEGFTDFYG